MRMCVRACVCERVRGKGKESESGGDIEGEKGRREGERRRESKYLNFTVFGVLFC